VGRDYGGNGIEDVDQAFQSARPRGARRFRLVERLDPARSFNPRARVGRDRFQRLDAAVPDAVSIRAPAWGATLDGASQCEGCSMFQSARPRGARRALEGRTMSNVKVSIRAPAWGATSGHRRGQPADHVSIRAPAWGATHAGCCSDWRGMSFNPRARVGRDAGHHPLLAGQPGFNPRARVGRDPVPCCCSARARCFNPRARVGRDC